ncbi:MAG: hypothetical protein JO159_11925 [Acidobacteria bacterium]|nr:hypothetical protein [Acidobacteriota bacterium]MBV9625233.1 hypothetical protein [Acidobacteriota bacterium]
MSLETSNPKEAKHQLHKSEQDEETGLDKTLADSFPASDPPSSIPGDNDGNEEEQKDSAA